MEGTCSLSFPTLWCHVALVGDNLQMLAAFLYYSKSFLYYKFFVLQTKPVFTRFALGLMFWRKHLIEAGEIKLITSTAAVRLGFKFTTFFCRNRYFHSVRVTISCFETERCIFYSFLIRLQFGTGQPVIFFCNTRQSMLVFCSDCTAQFRDHFTCDASHMGARASRKTPLKYYARNLSLSCWARTIWSSFLRP